MSPGNQVVLGRHQLSGFRSNSCLAHAGGYVQSVPARQLSSAGLGFLLGQAGETRDRCPTLVGMPAKLGH